LEDSLAGLNEKINSLIQNNNGNASQTLTNPYEEITIVHLRELDPMLRTHIKLSNLTINMNAFGEERTVTRQQLEELIGKYRNWFDLGIIAIGAGGEEYARRNKIKTIKDYPFKDDFIQKLATLNVFELEDMYKKLGIGAQGFIISYFKRKIIEKNSIFMDIHKLEVLNRLSNGSLKQEIAELTNIK